MTTEAKLQLLLDRMEITDTVNRVAVAADMRDWTLLRTAFADELEVDYTSLAGGKPGRMKAEELIASWRNGALGGFTRTQHIVSNHTINIQGDRATCFAQFQAKHMLPSETGASSWTLGGYYNYELARTAGDWRITKTKMTATWGAGNQQLAAVAAERAKQTNTTK